MFSNDTQSLKAELPKLESTVFSGILTVVSATQPSNALPPIVLTVTGISIVVIPVLENALSSMKLSFSGKVMLLRFTQLPNAPLPMELTLSESVTEVNAVQSANIPAATVELFIVTVVKDLQVEKTANVIPKLTVEGIVTLVKELQLANAHSATVFMLG